MNVFVSHKQSMRAFFKKLLILITKIETFKNIPTRRLKDDLISGINKFCFNKNFLENLKLADVAPIFKNKDKTFAENYRPNSFNSF